MNAYTVVYSALLVPAGRFADALGRKHVFQHGLLLLLGASAACGAAPTVGFLVAARAELIDDIPSVNDLIDWIMSDGAHHPPVWPPCWSSTRSVKLSPSPDMQVPSRLAGMPA